MKRKKKRHIDAIDYNSFDDCKIQPLNLEFGLLPESDHIACDDEVIFHTKSQ